MPPAAKAGTKTTKTKRAPRKPRAPREKPVESVGLDTEALKAQLERGLAAQAAVATVPTPPAVDPDIEAARVAKAKATPARPWAEPEAAPAPRKKRAADPDAEVSRMAKRLMLEEQEILDRIYAARAELGKKPGAKRELEQARVALQALRGRQPASVDDSGLPEGVKRQPGFVYRWVARTDSWGREDPRRSKVQQWKAYGGEVVKGADGKDVDGHYGVLMQVPYEGRAQREAESAPAGAARLSQMNGQIEDDVATWRNPAGQPYARLTGGGAQVVDE